MVVVRLIVLVPFIARVHSVEETWLARSVLVVPAIHLVLERDDVVENALRDVDLWNTVKDKLKSRATTLTLEQQQKLCIARLLPLKPDIILMDEPCSALDAEGIEKVENLIESLRDEYTVVIVTHNMAQARRATDECIFMLLGEIIEHSKTSELFLNPQREKTEMYIQGRYG